MNGVKLVRRLEVKKDMKTIILLTVLLLLNISQVYGEEYVTKNTTITVYKGEITWCFFGDRDRPTLDCNYLELGEKKELINKFLDFLVNGDLD